MAQRKAATPRAARDPSGKIAVKGKRGRRGDLQLTLFAPPEHPVVDELRQLDVNAITPLEAIAKLAELQQAVGRAFSPSEKPR